MKHKILIFSSLFLLIVNFAFLILDVDGYVGFLALVLDYIIKSSDEAKENIGWIATCLSVVMYAKLRFIDSRLFREMQKTYGKHQFLRALQVVNELLKKITPSELVARILRADNIDVEMKASVRALVAASDEPEVEPTLELSRAENKRLRELIKDHLRLVDQRMQLHEVIESGKTKLKRARVADELIAKRAKEKLLK